MDKAGESLKMLEKIIEVLSSDDDLSTNKNLTEIISDLEKIKNKIHIYLSSHEKFEN
jgi:hypothetical protein